MTEVVFVSDDRRYGLRIPAENMSLILKLCAQARPNETGGILAGLYTPDLDSAVVLAVHGPPPDSVQGRRHFIRGTQGLQRWLDELWDQKRQYYLGEWHYHPDASPAISSVDQEQMEGISREGTWRCPEPVLLIIGGNSRSQWSVKAYAFPGVNVEMRKMVCSGVNQRR